MFLGGWAGGDGYVGPWVLYCIEAESRGGLLPATLN